LAHAKEMNMKDSTIAMLKEEISYNHQAYYSADRLLKELDIFCPNVKAMSISEGVIYSEEDSIPQASMMVFLDYDRQLSGGDYTRIENWLKTRLKAENVKIVQQ
jgi:hypothetical protein